MVVRRWRPTTLCVQDEVIRKRTTTTGDRFHERAREGGRLPRVAAVPARRLAVRDEIEADLKEWVSSSLASRCGISTRRPSDSLGGVASPRVSRVCFSIFTITFCVHFSFLLFSYYRVHLVFSIYMMLFIFYVLLFTFPLPLSLVSYSYLEAWLGAPALALYTSATVALSDRLEVKGCKIVRKLHVNEVLHLVGASLAQRAEAHRKRKKVCSGSTCIQAR